MRSRSSRSMRYVAAAGGSLAMSAFLTAATVSVAHQHHVTGDDVVGLIDKVIEAGSRRDSIPDQSAEISYVGYNQGLKRDYTPAAFVAGAGATSAAGYMASAIFLGVAAITRSRKRSNGLGAFIRYER